MRCMTTLKCFAVSESPYLNLRQLAGQDPLRCAGSNPHGVWLRGVLDRPSLNAQSIETTTMSLRVGRQTTRRLTHNSIARICKGKIRQEVQSQSLPLIMRWICFSRHLCNTMTSQSHRLLDGWSWRSQSRSLPVSPGNIFQCCELDTPDVLTSNSR